MKRLIIIFIIHLSITGCATLPPIPNFEMTQGARIGLFISIGNQVRHAHIGTTVFNNFNKTYSYDWNLKRIAIDSFEKSLKQAGFIVVDLSEADFKFDDINALIISQDGKWIKNPTKSDAIEKLQKELNLQAIVILNEQRVMASMECSSGGCVERYIDGCGLYTRGILGVTQYKAVAALGTTIYLFNPPALLSAGGPLRMQWKQRAIALSKFPKPNEFRNITENEFEPVRVAIENYIANTADMAVKSFNSVDNY